MLLLAFVVVVVVAGFVPETEDTAAGMAKDGYAAAEVVDDGAGAAAVPKLKPPKGLLLPSPLDAASGAFNDTPEKILFAGAAATAEFVVGMGLFFTADLFVCFSIMIVF